MIFKIKHTPSSILMKTRLERYPQQIAKCAYSILCACGVSHIGERSRPLAMQLCEHRHNLNEGLLEKSKLAQHACKGGHRIGWDEVTLLKVESKSRYRKYKEMAHMAYLSNQIRQSNLDISLIWFPLSSNEVTNSQGNGPIRHIETCPDFFFHCKNTHNKIHCQNSSC
jgi:hypothetical protein